MLFNVSQYLFVFPRHIHLCFLDAKHLDTALAPSNSLKPFFHSGMKKDMGHGIHVNAHVDDAHPPYTGILAVRPCLHGFQGVFACFNLPPVDVCVFLGGVPRWRVCECASSTCVVILLQLPNLYLDNLDGNPFSVSVMVGVLVSN